MEHDSGGRAAAMLARSLPPKHTHKQNTNGHHDVDYYSLNIENKFTNNDGHNNANDNCERASPKMLPCLLSIMMLSGWLCMSNSVTCPRKKKAVMCFGWVFF